MSTRKWKLSKDKTNIMVVGNPLQIENLYFPFKSRLDQTHIKLSIPFRNQGIVLNEKFNLDYQVAAVSRKLLRFL